MSAPRALRSKKMPTPKFFLGTEDDGWITANVGGLRVLSLLGFILCGMRLERDFVENGVNKRFKGTVTFVWCNRLREQLEAYMGNEHAKMTMNVHVDYDDGDGETLDLWDLAQCSHWSMRMNDNSKWINLRMECDGLMSMEWNANARKLEVCHAMTYRRRFLK